MGCGMERACVACGKTFEADEEWKVKCLDCFLKSKGSEDWSTEKRITRLTLLKIAGHQVEGSAEEVLAYAKKLEELFEKW